MVSSRVKKCPFRFYPVKGETKERSGLLGPCSQEYTCLFLFSSPLSLPLQSTQTPSSKLTLSSNNNTPDTSCSQWLISFPSQSKLDSLSPSDASHGRLFFLSSPASPCSLLFWHILNVAIRPTLLRQVSRYFCGSLLPQPTVHCSGLICLSHFPQYLNRLPLNPAPLYFVPFCFLL